MDANESRLAERLADGEPEAYEVLYDLLGRDLHAYLFALSGRRHLAEDLLQAVMLRIVRSRDRLRSVRSLRAYLFRAARNEWIRRREAPVPSLEVVDEPMEPTPETDDRTHLRRAMARLAPERREVVVLKVHHGLTFAQIGEVLDLPADTAASRYRRALRDLRRQLETSDVRP